MSRGGASRVAPFARARYPGLVRGLGYLVGAASVALISLGDAAAADVKGVHRAAQQSVFKLEILDETGLEIGTGTGFVVAPNLVATNHHVIDDAYGVRVLAANGDARHAAAIVASSERVDLAILEVAERLPPPLILAPTAAEAGDEIVVLGSPLGMAGSLSAGIVAAVRDEGDPQRGFEPGVPVVQMTADTAPGSSGSPVMNARGEVIGVANSGMTGFGGLNFAIPVSELASMLDGLPETPARPLAQGPSGSRWAVARNVAISLLFFGLLYLGYRRL